MPSFTIQVAHMRRLRVYVDNSVISGTQDEEFAEESRRFFDLVG